MGYIKNIVLDLIRKHGTNCPYEIAENKGIHILFADLGQTSGLYNTARRFKFIHINNQLDEEIQRFVCAHELAHAVLHGDSNTKFLRSHTLFSIDKLEREANTFAVELMMPDELLQTECENGLTLHQISEMYGIPYKIMELKTL